jgi:hypothetical protein
VLNNTIHAQQVQNNTKHSTEYLQTHGNQVYTMTVCSYRLDSLWQIVKFLFWYRYVNINISQRPAVPTCKKNTRKKSGKYSMVFGIQANFKDTRQ